MNIINRISKYFPLDPIKKNYTRIVPYCFAECDTTPIDNPKIVCVSKECLELIGITNIDMNFIGYFSGNKKIPNFMSLCHCYSGYQFGVFAGQLGDGRAHIIGDVIHNNNYYEIQLKGSGLTPFSRKGDGRAVLRSSIREFLCSEFMYYLGIPTTRAGSIITSDTDVIRDKNYDGNISYEKATIVSRISPSFIRFGSFNVVDEGGPHEDKPHTIKLLINYIINNYYREILNEDISENEKILLFFDKVILNTAYTVSLWQAYGFVHGVLNTDNMSILGLTIDYGPYAFMETYNPNLISNTSDKQGRYSYKNQPNICKWNLEKLAQSIGEYYVEIRDELLNKVEKFCGIYKTMYINKMMKKMGFTKRMDNDEKILDSFIVLLYESRADYTNIFRSLLNLHLFDNNDNSFLEFIKNQSKNYSKDVNSKWINWMTLYKKRVLSEFTTDIDKCVLNRISLLEKNNPKYILRNSMAQKAIELAEKGDYTETYNLLNLLKNPYNEENKYSKSEYLNIDSSYNVSLSCST